MPVGGSGDPMVRALKTVGFSLVLLPRRNLAPLQVLTREGGRYVKLGSIESLFTSSTPLPTISAGEPAANISGKRTSKTDIGVTISILGTVIGAMGGETLGLEAQYRRAQSAAFEFQDVLQDSIEILALDKWLRGAQADSSSPHIRKLLENDQIYITTAMLRSNKFGVETTASTGQAVGLSVPTIQGIVGGKVKVAGEAEVSTRISYEGQDRLVFGFQALKLFFENGRYTAFHLEGADEGAMRALPGLQPVAAPEDALHLLGKPDFLTEGACFLPLVDPEEPENA